MTQDHVLVFFSPSGKRGRFPGGTPVLSAAQQLGVDIDSVCGGRGLCGRCQVLIAEGDFSKHGIRSTRDSVTPMTEAEQRAESRGVLAPGLRLSCSARLLDDAVVDVPASSQVHRQAVRKPVDTTTIILDPVVRLHYVEVQEPDMHNPASDLQRLLAALSVQWGLSDVEVDGGILAGLQAALRAGGWRVTVAVRMGRTLVGVWPGFKDRVFGIAIDVGSTTVAAHLCDLTQGEALVSAGVMNPQIRFGEDLMSRVSYAMMNPDGSGQMTSAIRQTLGQLSAQLAAEARIDATDILEITIVGNPIMHHLLLGIDPVELGGAPFALAVDSALTVPAGQLGLRAGSAARAYLLPCIAGHVGADTAGMILAERPDQYDAVTLLVDVGTNAEVVLGNRERMLACSSPTGPAFEGAQISCGQRAAAGAIERVRIDRETLEPRFKVIGSDLWSDEDGFAEAIAAIGVTGVCGSGIIELVAELFLAGVIDADGVIRQRASAPSARVVPDGRTQSYVLHQGDVTLRLTQNDVRAIQLAKAALFAGVRLLMERFGIEYVDRIRLAGAFGSHIDVRYAMVLGMIPDCRLEQVLSAGNAAGTGARIALLSAESRTLVERLVSRIEKVETAIEARFQQHFVDAMAIPHRHLPFRHLAEVTPLPPRRDAPDRLNASSSRRRGRRTGA